MSDDENKCTCYKCITLWWSKYQDIKIILQEFMKRNKIKTVEDAILILLETEKR